MKTALKIIVGLVAVFVLGVIVIAVGLYFISNSFMNSSYEVAAEAIQIPSDEETIARGEHIATSRGCTDCHGENLAGDVFWNDGAMGTLYASNLTGGGGGVGATYTDADWVLAIRHGVGLDNRPLLFMPSQEYWYFNDRDLAALIAYLKALPDVDNEIPEPSIGPLARVLYMTGELPLVPAELIDHTGRPPAPEPGITAEYGEYLAAGCIGCHGPGLSGGPIPGGPPDWPPASNLTPGGNLADWTEDDFKTALRTGVTPSGDQLSEAMPWQTTARMTDEELQALWLYLQSLPARPTGQR
jgi:mono/diheme cytochrome c family protein